MAGLGLILSSLKSGPLSLLLMLLPLSSCVSIRNSYQPTDIQFRAVAHSKIIYRVLVEEIHLLIFTDVVYKTVSVKKSLCQWRQACTGHMKYSLYSGSGPVYIFPTAEQVVERYDSPMSNHDTWKMAETEDELYAPRSQIEFNLGLITPQQQQRQGMQRSAVSSFLASPWTWWHQKRHVSPEQTLPWYHFFPRKRRL